MYERFCWVTCNPQKFIFHLSFPSNFFFFLVSFNVTLNLLVRKDSLKNVLEKPLYYNKKIFFKEHIKKIKFY